jgi:hypothetical protein
MRSVRIKGKKNVGIKFGEPRYPNCLICVGIKFQEPRYSNCLVCVEVHWIYYYDILDSLDILDMSDRNVCFWTEPWCSKIYSINFLSACPGIQAHAGPVRQQLKDDDCDDPDAADQSQGKKKAMNRWSRV